MFHNYYYVISVLVKENIHLGSKFLFFNQLTIFEPVKGFCKLKQDFETHSNNILICVIRSIDGGKYDSF